MLCVIVEINWHVPFFLVCFAGDYSSKSFRTHACPVLFLQFCIPGIAL